MRVFVTMVLPTVVFFVLLVIPGIAYAFSDSGFTSPFTCDQCHSKSSSSSADWEGGGPHGFYTTTTNKCKVCHSVHSAPAGGILLLSNATVSDTCLACHDGTGGTAPYDAIEARGGTVLAEHTVEVTTIVPGGTDELTDVLGCGSCHSVHRANVVDPFYRDTGYALASDQLIASDCLLRDDVGESATGTYTNYGAQWCAACHDQRHSQSGAVINHPVNTSYTFGYGEVTTTPGAGAYPSRAWGDGSDGSTFFVGMGQTNASYIMAPAAAGEDGRVENRQDPLCQQCHEDARDVDLAFGFDAVATGIYYGSNPVDFTFPHQSTNYRLLVETNDDLCLNCHPVSALP